MRINLAVSWRKQSVCGTKGDSVWDRGGKQLPEMTSEDTCINNSKLFSLPYLWVSWGSHQGNLDINRKAGPPYSLQECEKLREITPEEDKGSRWSLWANSDRTRGSSFKMKEKRLRLAIRGKIIYCESAEAQNNFPRVVVKVFKARLDLRLWGMSWGRHPGPWRGLESDNF